MSSNAQTWLASVTTDVEVKKEELNKVLYLFGLKVMQRLVMLSPVDTGHFKRNWQVSANFPTSREVPGVDKDGYLVLGEAEQKLSMLVKVPYVGTLWFNNNVDYAYDLEMGSSRQAPHGMIGVTKPLLPMLLDAAIAEAKAYAG